MRPLTLDEIADEVGGYPDKGESRRAAFERDKKTLRAEGVPLEVVPQHDGGSAYRIDPDAYYLPPLDLTDDERVALNLAVAAVALDGETGRDALWKLGEGAVDGPSVAALPTDDGLIDLFDAWRRGAPAHFTFHGRAARTARVGRRVPQRPVVRQRVTTPASTATGCSASTASRATSLSARIAPPTPAPTGYDLAAALPGRGYAMYPSDDVETVLVDVDAGWARGAISDLGEDAVVERRDDGSVRDAAAHHEPRRVPLVDLRLSRSRGGGRTAGRRRRPRRDAQDDGLLMPDRDPGLRFRRLLAMVTWLASREQREAERAGRAVRHGRRRSRTRADAGVDVRPAAVLARSADRRARGRRRDRSADPGVLPPAAPAHGAATASSLLTAGRTLLAVPGADASGPLARALRQVVRRAGRGRRRRGRRTRRAAVARRRATRVRRTSSRSRSRITRRGATRPRTASSIRSRCSTSRALVPRGVLPHREEGVARSASTASRR